MAVGSGTPFAGAGAAVVGGAVVGGGVGLGSGQVQLASARVANPESEAAMKVRRPMPPGAPRESMDSG
jgi:hypothetical protein